MDNGGLTPDGVEDTTEMQSKLPGVTMTVPDTRVGVDDEMMKEESGPTETLEDYSLISFFPYFKEKRRKHRQNKHIIRYSKPALAMLLVCAYLAYFIAALSIVSVIDREEYWCQGDGLLLLLTTLTTLTCIYFTVKSLYGKKIYNSALKPFKAKFDKIWNIWWVKAVFFVVILAALIAFLILDTKGNRQRLVSLVGLFVLILLGFLFSAAPRAIKWRHVIWGISLQTIMGIVILRWPVGIAVFKCLGDKTTTFLAFTDEGSKFVFGTLATDQILGGPIFAFSVLPVTLFFSFFVAILYYYGIMQWVVFKLGWALQVTVGTTMCESVNASANIFLGQTEAPLVIKPFLPLLTKSELHAVMTGGFATIAGSVMAAYIKIGVSASRLMSASVMNAPAALAYSKLFYPELEKTRTNSKQLPAVKSNEANVLHAAIEGVTTAIPLVANIGANLITFIAFVALFNAVFNWGCMLVNVEEGFCTFENIFGYIFMPLAWIMGVAWSECHNVGTLIALKTIINEFVAYSELMAMVDAGVLSQRAQIIATYALCGFSNISSIGMQLGGLGALAPTRKSDISQVVLRAMIAGSCASFMTACIAGALLDDDALEE